MQTFSTVNCTRPYLVMGRWILPKICTEFHNDVPNVSFRFVKIPIKKTNLTLNPWTGVVSIWPSSHIPRYLTKKTLIKNKKKKNSTLASKVKSEYWRWIFSFIIAGLIAFTEFGCMKNIETPLRCAEPRLKEKKNKFHRKNRFFKITVHFDFLSLKISIHRQ